MAITDQEFTVIVDSTKGAVLSAARRYLKHHDLIDDVAQEVYFALYQQIRKRPATELNSLNNYVYTITKNICFKFNQKESLSDTEDQLTVVASSEPDHVLHEMREAMSELPPKAKVPLQMFLDGFSLKEIGHQLNMSIAAVKTTLFRGRAMLIKKLKEERL